MAHTLSAKKRTRQTKKRALRNLSWKRRIKRSLKEARAQLTPKTLKEAQKMLDKAAKVGVVKRNKARRLKSRLSKSAKSKNAVHR